MMGAISLSTSSICLEEDEEEDIFVILEGVVEEQKEDEDRFAFECERPL